MRYHSAYSTLRRVCKASDATFVVHSRNTGIRQQTRWEMRAWAMRKLLKRNENVRTPSTQQYVSTQIQFQQVALLQIYFSTSLISGASVAMWLIVMTHQVKYSNFDKYIKSLNPENILKS